MSGRKCHGRSAVPGGKVRGGRRAVAGGPLLASAVVVALVAGVPAASVAASTPGPAQALAASIRAGEAQASVHWVETSTSKNLRTKFVTQAGRASGWQTIAETQGSVTATLTIDLVNGAAFMTGNAAGLYLQGLTQKAATAEAGQWLAVPASSKVYGPVVAGLTVESTMQELEMKGTVVAMDPPPGPGHLGPGYKGKTKPSQGLPSATEILYVSPRGRHLPVRAELDGAVTVFSGWGSAVNVTRPNGALALQRSWLRAG